MLSHTNKNETETARSTIQTVINGRAKQPSGPKYTVYMANHMPVHSGASQTTHGKRRGPCGPEKGAAWRPRMGAKKMQKLGPPSGTHPIPHAAPIPGPKTGSESVPARASTNSWWTLRRVSFKDRIPDPKTGAAFRPKNKQSHGRNRAFGKPKPQEIRSQTIVTHALPRPQCRQYEDSNQALTHDALFKRRFNHTRLPCINAITCHNSDHTQVLYFDISYTSSIANNTCRAQHLMPQ